jgi:hypothetical protein
MGDNSRFPPVFDSHSFHAYLSKKAMTQIKAGALNGETSNLEGQYPFRTD